MKPNLDNIRICSPQLGISETSVLGGEICDYEILKGLAKLGVKVDILLPKNRPYNKSIKNWRVEYAPIKLIPSYLFNLVQLPYLFKTYQKRKFQVIRLHAPYFTGIGAWFFRLFHPQVKLWAVYHQARRGFPFDLINKLFIKRWDLITTDSNAARKDLISRFNLSPNKIFAVHNGFPSFMKPMPKDKQLAKKLKLKGSQVLLFVGLFIDRKNPLFLVRLMKQLTPKFPEIKLLLVGDGPLKRKIKTEIKKSKLSHHIIVHKPVFGKAKQKIYALADIFVHPAIHEGFPLVVVEAMACGKPVIIADKPWAKEAVSSRKNGYLVSTKSVNNWDRKISLLLKNERLKASFGRTSTEIAHKRFRWEIATRKQLKLLHRLIVK